MNAVINFEELIKRRISHIQVRGEGIVTAILNDDTVGRKHQRFVLELAKIYIFTLSHVKRKSGCDIPLM